MKRLTGLITTKFIMCFVLAQLCAIAVNAQTTAFTYQGRFTDSTASQPTNGTYNMQFALFDAAAGGGQVGATVNIPTVSVVDGIFTVSLDYTPASFDGTPRFLQVTIGNTVLSPRQEITSAPYAIMARNALQANDSVKLGGINADQYVTGQVVRNVNNLNGNVTLAAGANITITPSGNTLTIASTGAGGGNGINNQTSVQTAANFNIDGTGAANIFNTATQFNIGGVRVLSVAGTGNLFAGVNTGTVNTGSFNSFVGQGAGQNNTTGGSNSFFGRGAGASNTTGGNNSFVGTGAGFFNNTGFNNSFFGSNAGAINLAGTSNSFFGSNAGLNNVFGISNSFVGTSAGFNNSTGSNNSFFGRGAGAGNTTGDNNTVIGDSADVGSGGLTFATAIGAGALVSTSNTVVLGTTSDTVVAPNLLRVNSLGAAGSTSLCRNALNQISTCTPGNFTNSGDGKNNEQLNVLQRQNLQMLEQLKAQQEENAAQAEQIKQQRTQLQKQQKLMDGLQKIVCTQNPRAKVCKEQK